MKVSRPIVSILTRQIQPAFFAAPTDAGGGAAVIEAPAAPAAPATEDPNAAILDFQAPDMDAVDAAMKNIGETPPMAGTKPPPEPKKEAAKTEPAKPEGKTPAAKPTEKEPPVAQLRKEYEATKTELESHKTQLAEMKTRLEAGDPRIKEKESEVTAARQDLERERARVKELEQRTIEHDARTAPEVVAMDVGYEKKAGAFHSRVLAIDTNTVWALTRELAQINPGNRDAIAAFHQKVNTALGATEDSAHPQLEKTLDFIEESRDYAMSRQEKIAAIQKDAEGFQVKRSSDHYQNMRSRVDKALEEAAKPPEGMAETNPLHPEVVLDRVFKELGEEGAQFDRGIDDFWRLVFAGVPPRSSKDFAGMTEAQITEARMEEVAKVQKARDLAVRVGKNGTRALRVMPHLMREIARLRAKAGEDSEGAPPDPSASREAVAKPTEEEDLKNFKFDESKVPEFA